MTATLEQVIESLRNELQQCGEMLALLEAQHRAVAHQESGAILTFVAAVEAQSRAMSEARRTRETHQRQLAWSVAQPDNVTFQELLPFVPSDYRPLIGALVQEINQLLTQVRQLAEQNQHQLRRSLELMERFLVTISQHTELPLLTAVPNTIASDPQPPISKAVV